MGLEWQIKDSDWAQMILKLSVNLNMRKSGLAGQKMFLIRFNKIFWTENVCALSAMPVRKTNSAVFDNRPVCASLISNQGHRAEMGRNRPVCEKMSFCHRLD